MPPQDALPDLADPRVVLALDATIVPIGGAVDIDVLATDDVELASVSLVIDGAPVTLVDGAATWQSGTPGMFEAIATAEDAVGNVDEAVVTIIVADPADTLPAVATLESPLDGETLTQFTELVGVVEDGGGDVDYDLSWSVQGADQWTTLLYSAGPLFSDVLGSLDPGLMFDGWIDLRLRAFDRGGNVSTHQVRVKIDAPIKTGNMTIDFVDLRVPMSGVPLQVKRTYDSRKRGVPGDFGHGWNLDTDSARITKSRPEGEMWWQDVILLFFTPYYRLIPLDDASHQVSIDLGGGAVRDFDFSVFSNLGLQPWHTTPAQNAGAQWTETTSTGAELYGGVGQPASVFLQPWGELYGAITNELYDMPEYQLLMEDGTVVVIHREDGIKEITDPQGNHVEFTDLGVFHTSGGNSVPYTRDAEGRITSVMDPDGALITYEYDDRGDLIAVTDRDGNTTGYTYTADHYLQDVLDPNGTRLVRNYYDDTGRLTMQCDGQGLCTDMDYDPALGQELRYDRNGFASVVTYNDQGEIIVETDPLGRTVSFDWDADGNLLEEVSPSGAAQTHTYNGYFRSSTTDYSGCQEEWVHDGGGRVVQHSDKLGRVRSTAYDGHKVSEEIDRLGHITSYTYDLYGNPLTKTDRTGAVTTWTYDSMGRKLSETDAEGGLTEWTHDASGKVLTETTAAGTTTHGYDADGNLNTVTYPDGAVDTYYFDATGREVGYVDALGRQTSYEFDFNGNRIRENLPDGTSRATSWDAEDQKIGELDEAGNPTSWILDPAGQVVELQSVDGSWLLSDYDEDGNLVSEEDALGNISTYTYDAMGHRLSSSDPLGNTTIWTYDCGGQITQVEDPNGNLTQYQYDEEGRRLQTIHGAGTPEETTSTLVLDAEGRVIERIANDGTSWLYGLDGLGQLATVTDPLGNTTTYERDAMSNVTSMTDAEGRVTIWTHDVRGRPTSKTTPGGRVTSWTYDLVGNETSITDPSGGVTTLAWDDMDRLIERVFPDGSVETTTWDAMGLRTSVDVDGDVTAWTYDARGRQLSQSNPDGSSLEWTYDLMGRLETTTGTVGALEHTITRTYDAAGRLATVGDGARSTAYLYDEAGNRTGEERSNGSSSSWSYDPVNRLTHIEHFDASGATMAAFEYALDAVGNRVGVTEADGSTVDWTYDAAHRLVAEERAGAVSRSGSWVYDAVGNRIEQTVDAVTTSRLYDIDDRLLSDGTSTYTWNEVGQQIGRDDGTTAQAFEWDARGRLLSVSDAQGDVVTYEYDALGQRISRTDGSITRHYLVDGNRELAMVLMEHDGAGGLQAAFTYGDELVAQERGGERWYLKDGVGSVRALADELGDFSDEYVYDAWGETLDAQGVSENDYRFGGEQLDPLIGWYYLRARYLDPSAGRFASEDPAEGTHRDPRSLHRYTYTPQDPVNYADPSGESWASLARAALAFSFSLSWAAYAARFMIQMIFWSIKATLMTTYVLAPATQLMQLGGNLGGPIGAAVTRAGVCIAQWGIKWILVQFAWTFVYAAVPILGTLLVLYNLYRFRNAIMFMVRHRALIPQALQAALVAEHAIRNIPNDIPRGNRLSDCIEAQSGIPARRLDRAVTKFKQDHGAGRPIQPSLQQLMGLMIPIYAAISACAAALQQQE